MPAMSSLASAPSSWRVWQLLRTWPFALWCIFAGVMPVFSWWQPDGRTSMALMVLAMAMFASRRNRAPWSVQLAVDLYTRRLKKRLAGEPRIRLRTSRPRFDLLVMLLLGGLSWILPLFVGAYSVRNPGVGAHLLAVGLFVAMAALFGFVVFAHEPVAELAIGRDGVTIGGRFVPYGQMTSVVANDAATTIGFTTEAGAVESLSIDVQAANAAVGAAIEERRVTAAKETPASREVEAREAPGFRVADLPRADLVRRLTDGATPREERVRVAELLRVHAPEEVDAIAESTADEELALVLRAR